MNKNLPIFQGMSKPSSDFPAVRSELRAWPNYTEVDLSTARSLVAGTAARLPLCGNMIYIDPKANGGYATLHVQDDASVGNTPITALPGQLLRVPFTEIIFENDAQPGQVMRIIYGTDLEFYPSNAAGVSVLNAINVNDVVNPGCQVIRVDGTLTVGSNQVTTLLAAASNPRGFVLRNADMILQSAGGGLMGQNIIAALTAPTVTNASKTNAHIIMAESSNAGVVVERSLGFSQRRFPAGWGIWVINDVTVGAATQALARVSLELL